MTCPPPTSSKPVLVLAPTIKRKPIFSSGAYAREAIECLYRVQVFNPFTLHAFVVMPSHCNILLSLHTVTSLTSLMNVWRRAVEFEMCMPVWQNRFECKVVEDVERAMKMMHAAPVKEKLCVTPDEYPWSSASGRWEISHQEEKDPTYTSAAFQAAIPSYV